MYLTFNGIVRAHGSTQRHLTRQFTPRHRVTELSKYLVGCANCQLGRNFSDSIPSPVVIQHRDIDVSVLYRFTMGVPRLSQDDDDDAARRARKRQIVREMRRGPGLGNVEILRLFRVDILRYFLLIVISFLYRFKKTTE